MSFLSPARAVSALLLAFFLAGCAQNTVRLVYTPATENSIPIAGAPHVSVVRLKDARAKTDIGKRSDGSAFLAGSDVAEWISHALAEELSRVGVLVTFAPSEEQARAAGAAYIVSGSIEEVWLNEISSTSYDCSMRAVLTMKDAKSTPLKNTFTSTLSRRVVPLSSVPQEMLSEAVGDLVRPMANAVRQKVRP